MTDIDSTASDVVGSLVAALPEKYQPIFGHPELSDGSSRDCQDRLVLIRDCVRLLQARLGRSLRILDLGCAQGYFSLSLAADGHSVRGIDYLASNVAVCQALAVEHGLGNATFECASVEDVLDALQDNQFDLVLGLSVFHHLVHTHGFTAVHEQFMRLSARVAVGIYEMALREEPLYWGPSQPEHPARLLEPYAFRRVLAHMPTHLSGIDRPLYVASSRYWLIGGHLSEIRDWREESHADAMGSHQGTRRYLFGDGAILKQYALDSAELGGVNLLEYEREVAFLSEVPAGFAAPRLLDHGKDERSAWILREMLPGVLLSEAMAAHTPYPFEQVLDGLLEQLVALEEAGLYHNDVRCWNLLIEPGRPVALIDYGAIGGEASDCVWPDNLFLALLITFREIVQGHVMRPYPVRRPLLDVALLPARYRNAFLRLFALPQAQWSFRLLRQFSLETGDQPLPPWGLLASSFERALLEYEKAIDAGNRQRAGVERELQESLANAHRWFELASDRERALAEAVRQYEAKLAELAQSNQEELERLVQRHEAAIIQLLDEKEKAISEWSWQYESESARISEIRRRLELLHARHADVRHEADRTKEALDASLSNAHHWYIRATEAERQLATVIGSRSWRLTRPLRFAVRMLRAPLEGVRRLAAAAIRRVMARPLLARSLNAVIRLVPPLHSRLRKVATDSQILGVVPPEPRVPPAQVGSFADASPEVALARLTSRGRQWYEALRVERERTN